MTTEMMALQGLLKKTSDADLLREMLGYLTPIQAFFKGLGKNIQIQFA